MKTISGKPISTKPISLSKAAKILKKFVSAENGASHVVSVYLNRASTAFNELKQLHKEINSPCSDRKHKRDRSETHDHSAEQNQGAEKSKNEFRKHQDSIEEHAEKDGGNEKHKKKKKKQEDESKKNGVNDTVEIEEGSNKGKISKADDIKGMEGKKHKKEKNKKEDKDSDGVKTAQKKRKNEDVEGKVEERSCESKKKIKRKHGGDS